MSYKQRMIDMAISIAADIYKVPEEELRKMGVRNKSIMEARRIVIFYLNRFVGVRHNSMKNYIKKMHHATSIHHCNKMEFFLLYDPPTKETYDYFQSRMKEFDLRNEIIKDKQMQVVQLQAEINDYLKTQNNDKRI
tara:strand:- start:575 stop:982 length:408 start_codon:yes stop_codon:yes gene_type:complete